MTKKGDRIPSLFDTLLERERERERERAHTHARTKGRHRRTEERERDEERETHRAPPPPPILLPKPFFLRRGFGGPTLSRSAFFFRKLLLRERKRDSDIQISKKIRLFWRNTKGGSRERDSGRNANRKCQRCFSVEHWTYECALKPGDAGTYVKRQSKSEMLKQSGKKFQEFARFGKNEELQFDEKKRRDAALKRKVDKVRGGKRKRSSSSSSSSVVARVVLLLLLLLLLLLQHLRHLRRQRLLLRRHIVAAIVVVIVVV